MDGNRGEQEKKDGFGCSSIFTRKKKSLALLLASRQLPLSAAFHESRGSVWREGRSAWRSLLNHGQQLPEHVRVETSLDTQEPSPRENNLDAGGGWFWVRQTLHGQEGSECGSALLENTPQGIKAGLGQTVPSTEGLDTEAALLSEAQPAPPLLLLARIARFAQRSLEHGRQERDSPDGHDSPTAVTMLRGNLSPTVTPISPFFSWSSVSMRRKTTDEVHFDNDVVRIVMNSQAIQIIVNICIKITVARKVITLSKEPIHIEQTHPDSDDRL
jgi:hypothetical protein